MTGFIDIGQYDILQSGSQHFNRHIYVQMPA